MCFIQTSRASHIQTWGSAERLEGNVTMKMLFENVCLYKMAQGMRPAGNAVPRASSLGTQHWELRGRVVFAEKTWKREGLIDVEAARTVWCLYPKNDSGGKCFRTMVDERLHKSLNPLQLEWGECQRTEGYIPVSCGQQVTLEIFDSTI